MADEEVSLFLVVTFGPGPYWGGIYEIKFVTGGGGSNYPIVSPLLKAFENEERTYIPFGVGCDISGSEIRLVASCRDVHDVRVNFHQFKPYLFNTNTKESSEFQCPKTVKPFPIVIVVREKFYVLAGGTMVPSYNIQPPSFELLYPPESRESSSLPEFRMDTELPIIVSGFAVIEDDCILISVYDFMFCCFKTEFYCYKIGSSMREWKSVGKEEEEGEEDVIYYPFFGKAAYVDHHVYTFGHDNLLMVYSVGLSADGIVQSLGAPFFFPPLPFLPLPPKSVPELGGGFAHLGSKIFCMMKTGSRVRLSNIQSVQFPNIQIVSILIGRVYGEMQFETLHALICALDMENLGDANITSLCLDSQQSKYAHNADFWKGGPKVLPNKLFEEPYQPKPESVPEGSQAARKRIDMHDLVDLTDDDLKDLGLPELRDTGMSQPVPVGALAFCPCKCYSNGSEDDVGRKPVPTCGSAGT